MCTIGIAKMVLNSVPEASRYRQFVLLKEKSYQCKGPPKKNSSENCYFPSKQN